MRASLALAFLLLLAACAPASTPPGEDEPQRLVLEPVSFGDLPGWRQDDLSGLAAAISTSCARISPQPGSRKFGTPAEAGTIGDWKKICRELSGIGRPAALRAALESMLQPYAAKSSIGTDTGLFTGYYEAQLNGSRTASERYSIALLRKPNDLVAVSLGDFRESLKGERIAGKIDGGRLRPYETRAEIAAGALGGRAEPLVWVDDELEKFFLQVQGSGRVLLDDGSVMRVGYAGTNGHVYYAIGRELIKRGEVPREKMSLQAIRSWAAANPDQVSALLDTNASYIFFREIEGDGPIGSQGAPLTPRRSLAVDRLHVPLGSFVWIDLDHPESPGGTLRRLMVAQDTGGAIRGPVRGDFFWGYGPDAEMLAGPMKAQGRYFLLLPKEPSGSPISLN